MAIIEGQLTTIGGCNWDPNVLYTVFRRKEYEVTKKLLTLQSNKWMEYFPPLPIERNDVAAVTTEQYLIVAGGKYRGEEFRSESISSISTQKSGLK